jgi:hypothetical protein
MPYFHSYGGWNVTETETLEQAAAEAAAHMVKGFDKRARVVEVEIWKPWSQSYEYIWGYTFDGRIPPHRKETADVDCKITVTHHLDIRQGRD